MGLYSCDEPALYEEYVAIPDQGWHQDSVVTFEVMIEDTASAYRVGWHLRNNNNYPYSNIFLFREVTSQRGREFADTAEFMLADPYGKWLGKGVGELKTNSWPFKDQLLMFKQPGAYVFKLQQAMYPEYLQGLEDVGLSIYKVSPEDGEEKG